MLNTKSIRLQPGADASPCIRLGQTGSETPDGNVTSTQSQAFPYAHGEPRSNSGARQFGNSGKLRFSNHFLFPSTTPTITTTTTTTTTPTSTPAPTLTLTPTPTSTPATTTTTTAISTPTPDEPQSSEANQSSNVQTAGNLDGTAIELIRSCLGQHQMKMFPSMRGLEEFARKIAVAEGFNFVKGNTHRREDNKEEYRYLELLCHMHNAMKPLNSRARTARLGTSCQFKLVAKFTRKTNSYSFKIFDEHNHGPIRSMETLAAAERLKPQVKELAITLYNEGKSIKAIHEILCSSFENERIARSTVAGFIQCYRNRTINQLPEGTMLFAHITSKNWLAEMETDGKDVVEKAMFYRPEQKEMLRYYGHVLLLNCTYNTNNKRLPLLHATGISPFGKTYQVCFMFFTDESEATYTWALEGIKEMYPEGKEPGVLITEGDLDLANAIKNVFPKSNHLLCTFYVDRSVNKKLKSLKYPEDLQKNLYEAWKDCMRAEKLADFEKYVQDIRTKFHHCTEFLTYMDSLLLPLKEKYVPVWTNRVECYGIKATSKLEASYGHIKDDLKNRNRDVKNTFNAIDAFCKEEFAKFQGQLLDERGKRLVIGHQEIFCQLGGKLSSKCVDMVKKEYKKAIGLLEEGPPPTIISTHRGTDDAPKQCDCVVKEMHGIPCCHNIEWRIRNNKPLHEDDFPKQWRLAFDSPFFDRPWQNSNLPTSEEVINAAKQSLEMLRKHDLATAIRACKTIHEYCLNPPALGLMDRGKRHWNQPPGSDQASEQAKKRRADSQGDAR